MRLMEMEVPEIYDGTVVIRGCVRQPGDRAKVAVSSRERDVDPVGACVGMRGSRVQAIMRELRGERIDIIQYSDDLITYAQNALSPAKITRVSAMPADDEAEPEIGADGEPVEPVPTLECIVEEDQLSLAIGKRGQNVRLAAALIGARIEIKSEQAVKAEVAQALQRMLLASQRRGTALAEVPGPRRGGGRGLRRPRASRPSAISSTPRAESRARRATIRSPRSRSTSPRATRPWTRPMPSRRRLKKRRPPTRASSSRKWPRPRARRAPRETRRLEDDSRQIHRRPARQDDGQAREGSPLSSAGHRRRRQDGRVRPRPRDRPGPPHGQDAGAQVAHREAGPVGRGRGRGRERLGGQGADRARRVEAHQDRRALPRRRRGRGGRLRDGSRAGSVRRISRRSRGAARSAEGRSRGARRVRARSLRRARAPAPAAPLSAAPPVAFTPFTPPPQAAAPAARPARPADAPAPAPSGAPPRRRPARVSRRRPSAPSDARRLRLPPRPSAPSAAS